LIEMDIPESLAAQAFLATNGEFACTRAQAMEVVAICPSCGIQFGYNDHRPGLREHIYREWRAAWLANGRQPLHGPQWRTTSTQIAERASDARDEQHRRILAIGHDTSIRGVGISLRDALNRARYRELGPVCRRLIYCESFTPSPSWSSSGSRTLRTNASTEDGTSSEMARSGRWAHPSLESAFQRSKTRWPSTS
jgi:hypothetical protein